MLETPTHELVRKRLPPQVVEVKRVCQCPGCGLKFTEGEEAEVPFPTHKPDKGITLTTRVKQLLN